MQDDLNTAMEREENLFNGQLESHKTDIMKIKRKNLDYRLYMATEEMSTQQAAFLKEQYEKEF